MNLSTTQEIAIRFVVQIITLAFEANSLPSPLDGRTCCDLFTAARHALDDVALDGDRIVTVAIENGEWEYSDLEKTALEVMATESLF